MKTHEKENTCDQKCTWHVKLNRNNQEKASMNLYKNSDPFYRVSQKKRPAKFYVFTRKESFKNTTSFIGSDA